MDRYRNLDLLEQNFAQSCVRDIQEVVINVIVLISDYYSITIILMKTASISYKLHGSECCNITPNEGKG